MYTVSLNPFGNRVVPTSEFPARYKEIKDANFTAILGGFGATTPTAAQAQLAAAAEVGLGVITAGSAGISDFQNASNLWGYQLKDEPKKNEFPALKNWSDSIEAEHKGKLRFINLLPNCGILNATDYDGTNKESVSAFEICGFQVWGCVAICVTDVQFVCPAASTYLNHSFSAGYTDYVGSFVQTVQPDVLSMDSYPDFLRPRGPAGQGDTRDDYRSNVNVMRTYSLAAGIPFWNFLSSMPVRARLRH
jgi:hypothetical protein